jgi:hypothetical protein
MNKYEHDEVCKACGGTGLYQGMAESPGFAVVCNKCNGSGCFHYIHTFETFKKRKRKKEIITVLQTNPGIKTGCGIMKNGDALDYDSFGGMKYGEWNKGKPFPKKSEMRRFTCPAWWYQSADYKKKPDWEECEFGSFSRCSHFKTKDKCWERWDNEQESANE